MSEIERLVQRYAEAISIPWHTVRSDAERTLFVIYERTKERQLRYQLTQFETATLNAGKSWLPLDVTDSFADWFDKHDLRDEYFEHPQDLPGYKTGQLVEFENHLAKSLMAQVKERASSDTAVAVIGVGSLYGLARVSGLMRRIASAVPGRLIVFFPGEKVDNNYRLLGARDGWDYLATAITAD